LEVIMKNHEFIDFKVTQTNTGEMFYIKRISQPIQASN
jgi:hypothetical protein